MNTVQKENLLKEIEKLHKKNEFSRIKSDDYFEPGNMEYLEHYDGYFVESTGEIVIRFEAKGTRYEGRTEQIEKVKIGDPIRVSRDKENIYNPNNFMLMTHKGQNVGTMPAELCNAIAPLYDAGELEFIKASVSYVEPISKRSRYAKQAMLFVELRGRVHLL